MKNLLEDSPWINYVVILLVGGVAAFLIYKQVFGGRGGPSSIYFYNLETEGLVSVSSDEIAPIDLGDGAIGVEAYVVTCSEDGEKVLYLSKMSDAAKAVRQKYPGQVPVEEVGPMLARDATLISTPALAAEGVWHPEKGGEGGAIVSKALGPCPSGGTHTFLLP